MWVFCSSVFSMHVYVIWIGVIYIVSIKSEWMCAFGILFCWKLFSSRFSLALSLVISPYRYLYLSHTHASTHILSLSLSCSLFNDRHIQLSYHLYEFERKTHKNHDPAFIQNKRTKPKWPQMNCLWNTFNHIRKHANVKESHIDKMTNIISHSALTI